MDIVMELSCADDMCFGVLLSSFNQVNLVLRYGVGLIVDVERGYVLTDRYTVPQPLVHVELTFAQTITVRQRAIAQ
eukprot:1250201-Amphidinium_carterae.1